uniref:Uncharacterized protein n=1 Tax=Octopus bimaculoides TaxID=37653 RepID=A0A0L8IDT0_OCTBM
MYLLLHCIAASEHIDDINQLNMIQPEFNVESLYYYLLLFPASVVVIVVCLFLNWFGLKLFQHN